MDNLISQIKVETLYYFYSAVFQGFAAMFTLILMFIIYYLQKNEEKRYYLEKRMEDIARITFASEFTKEVFYEGKGIYNYVSQKKEEGKVTKDDHLFILSELCEKVNRDERIVKILMGLILMLSFVILLSSILFLQLIDSIFLDKNLIALTSKFTIILIIVYFALSFILMYKIIGYKIIGKVGRKILYLLRKLFKKKNLQRGVSGR